MSFLGSPWCLSRTVFRVTVEQTIGLVALFLVTFLVSLLVVAAIVVNLPPTYFLNKERRDLWVDHHPIVRWAGIAAKNLLGVGLVLLGLALSVPGIPGQGLLTILIGVMLLDFPGKRRLERYLVGRPRVLKIINALRHRFGKRPLVLDDAG